MMSNRCFYRCQDVVIAACVIAPLVLHGTCVLAADATGTPPPLPVPATQATDDYVRKLDELHVARKKIVQEATQLLAKDEALRKQVMNDQYAAAATQAVGQSIPSYTVDRAVVRVPDKDKDKSSSKSDKDDKTVTLYHTESHAPEKMAMAWQARAFAMRSAMAKGYLGQNADAIQKLQDQLEENLDKVREAAEPFGSRGMAELADAVAALDEFVRADESDMGALVSRAVAQQRLGNLKQASADFEKAAAQPTSIQPVAMAGHGYLLCASGQPREGLIELQKAIMAGGKARLEEPYLYRALAYCDQGKLREARADIASALRSDPKCVPALRLQAILDSMAGNSTSNSEKAVKSATRAVELTFGRDWMVLEALAAAHAAAGSFDAAAEQQTKAVELVPGEFQNPVQQRLGLYQLHKPYVVDWKTTGKLVFDPAADHGRPQQGQP